MMSNVHIITNYNVNANHAFIKPVDKPGSQHPVQGSDGQVPIEDSYQPVPTQ